MGTWKGVTGIPKRGILEVVGINIVNFICDEIITYFFTAFVHTRMAKYKPMEEDTPQLWVWIGE